MVRRTMVVGLLVLTVVLAACGGSQADTTRVVDETGQTVSANRTPFAGLPEDFEMPLSMKLSMGTLMLEETAYAVTPEQAQELLPLWQMLRALQESGTSSEVEVEAVYKQIEEAMTSDQLAAIEEMSPEDMQALMQELRPGRQGDSESDEGETRSFGRPEGMMPPGGVEGGGFGAPEGMMSPGGGEGMGPGGFGDLSAEEQATAMAGRGGMGLAFGGGFTEQVIELLEARAAEA
jgi:hypothetical protein